MAKKCESKIPVSYNIMGGMQNSLFDIEQNTVASDFISNNYEEMVRAALKMGVDPSKANDIVHDVYVSLRKNEENGEGYDISKGHKAETISVEQFVYGRLKLYSKNIKYRSNTEKSAEVCASSTTSNVDEMSTAQRAYESASSYDQIAALDDRLSISEELEYVLSFESSLKINLRYIFKELRNIANSKVDNSVFDTVRKMCSTDEIKEAFTSIVMFSKSNPDEYDNLVMAL